MIAKRGIRYAHTNLIAHDWRKLAHFYEAVFDCVPVPPARDQSGSWLAKATGVPKAHLNGMHLRLPGHGDQGPTLEIYTYASVEPQTEPVANRAGYGHLAFVVEDVNVVLNAVVAAGGSRLGEVVTVPVEGVGILQFTYARDPEGNLLELQRWDG